MKTKLFTLALMLLFTAAFAQTKKELLTSKKWNYSGIEEFGVVKPPDSTMKNDNIALMADGTFIMVKKNKKTNGTWSDPTSWDLNRVATRPTPHPASSCPSSATLIIAMDLC